MALEDELGSAGSLAILFDIDETLISTGGAGARSWRWAFQTLYEVPADIGAFSEAGMTDPEVARGTFRGAIGREPTGRELARILAAYLERLRTRSKRRHSTGFSPEPSACYNSCVTMAR